VEFLFLLDNVLVWEYRANVHLLQCWHWSRSKRHSAGFLFTFKHNLHILDMSGTVSSRQVPHMRQACYSGPEMCKPGSSKTYTNPLPTTGLSQAVFCTNAAPNAFLTSATPHSPPSMRPVLTDDKRQVQPINTQWHAVWGTAAWLG